MKTATLHVKITPSLAEELKQIARRRELPVGELVREAVVNRYQIDFSSLPDRQRRALHAYQGGYISIGKLSEEMGMNLFEMRAWLADHGMSQNNQYSDRDCENA